MENLHYLKPPCSWKVVELVFLRKPDAAPQKGIRIYQATALTSVIQVACKLRVLRLERDKGPGKVELAHGCANGVNYHLQVLTMIFFAKTLGIARRGEPCDATWDSGETDNVRGKFGHQDCLRQRRNRNTWLGSWMTTLHVGG